MFGAVALYGIATVVRGERWQRLLRDEGATPSRRDAQELNAVGYMGNNLLPARAGDAVRVFLMTPRAGGVTMRSVVGTLLAERLLDVGLLVVIFIVVGYGLLGVGFMVAAFVRTREIERALDAGGFAPLHSKMLLAATAAGIVLGALTVVVIVTVG